MAKKLFSVILFLTIMFCKGNAQIDSAKFLYSAKLQLTSEGYFGDSVLWQSFLNSYSARFLQSKGFDAVRFILIEKKELDDSLIAARREWYENNQLFFECLYVVAYNPKTRLFYKLKGFRICEIADFKLSLDKFSSGSAGTFYLNSKGSDVTRLLKKEFCFVESLDLECLRKYLWDKTAMRSTIKYPCITSCFYRDMRL